MGKQRLNDLLVLNIVSEIMQIFMDLVILINGTLILEHIFSSTIIYITRFIRAYFFYLG